MESNNLMTKAPQVGAEEQLINGKSVDDHDFYSSRTHTLVKEKLLKRKIKYTFSYLAAKDAGFKMVFLKGNRKVYYTQLEHLWKSAKNKKQFAESCYVVPLRPIMEAFPDIEVYDLTGNKVTYDSSNVDSCLVVYDGQHRITVCELHQGEIDVELELNDFNGIHPLETIKLMNSFSRNWNCNDLRFSNISTGKTTNQLYQEAEKLQSLYGITTKLAEYILTFKREATKKRDLVEGKDTSLYNEENGKRGLGIYNAIMMNFNGAKEIKKLEIMDAIVYTYDTISDTDKGVFARNMKICMGTLPENDRNNIKSLITEKDYGQVKKSIKQSYEDFCKSYTEKELARMENEIDRNSAIYIVGLETTNKAKFTKRPLASGSINQIIQNKRSLSAISRKERLAKAEKKVAEAQSLVEKLKVGILK